MDIPSIRKRLEHLQREVEQISRADRIHKTKGHRRAQDIPAHEARIVRMRMLLDEIARLTPRKIGPDV